MQGPNLFEYISGKPVIDCSCLYLIGKVVAGFHFPFTSPLCSGWISEVSLSSFSISFLASLSTFVLCSFVSGYFKTSLAPVCETGQGTGIASIISKIRSKLCIMGHCSQKFQLLTFFKIGTTWTPWEESVLNNFILFMPCQAFWTMRLQRTVLINISAASQVEPMAIGFLWVIVGLLMTVMGRIMEKMDYASTSELNSRATVWVLLTDYWWTVLNRTYEIALLNSVETSKLKME